MGLYSIYQDEYAGAQLNMEENLNNAQLTKVFNTQRLLKHFSKLEHRQSTSLLLFFSYKWLKLYYNLYSTHINTQHETNSVSSLLILEFLLNNY